MLHVQKKTRSVFPVWKLRRSFVLCFTEFLILALLSKGIHWASSPEDRKKIPLVFVLLAFFLYKNSSYQAEKTFPRCKCFEELHMLKVLCLGPNQDQALHIPILHSSLEIRRCFSWWYLQVLCPFLYGKPALCCLSLREKSGRFQSCCFGCEMRGCGSAFPLQRHWLLRRGVICKHQFGGE